METTKQYIQPEDLFPAIKELLEQGYEAEFTVTGNSMWPLLRHGRDTVILRKCREEALKIGDIVLFEAVEGRYILHRITGMQGKLMQTTGDGNLFRDGWFPKASVLGCVARVKRKGRELSVGKRNWKLLAAVWNLLFPFRKWLFKLWNTLKKLLKR